MYAQTTTTTSARAGDVVVGSAGEAWAYTPCSMQDARLVDTHTHAMRAQAQCAGGAKVSIARYATAADGILMWCVCTHVCTRRHTPVNVYRHMVCMCTNSGTSRHGWGVLVNETGLTKPSQMRDVSCMRYLQKNSRTVEQGVELQD